MFDSSKPRIGFCCKWLDNANQINGLDSDDEARAFNTGATTVAWLNRQSRGVAEERLWSLMKQNIEATRRLVERVGSQEAGLRMVRLSSDILPVYTEPNWRYFWQQSDVRRYAELHFAKIGEIARQQDVRLSFHPGQFVVLASDNPDIVARSIEEFEYHVDMARWMGYGQQFQDFKINVHIAGRRGPEGILEALPQMSAEARNCITIENDEMSWGINDSLELAKHCALVLDIHHHYLYTGGDYISSKDDRIEIIKDSWRGVRPVIHYSVSREDYLVDHPQDQLPDYELLLESGYKKGKLRAHSDFYWNSAVNQWALTHLTWASIMCESKSKNLASFALYEEAKRQGYF